jgi:hypothetical protein
MTSLFPPFTRRTSFRKQPFFYEAGRGVYMRGLGGPVAALNLNFLSGTLDPRITFSRPSNATQYDSTGKLIYAPANLLLQSNTPSNAAYTKSNLSITTGVTDPNGGTTASTLTATLANGRIYQGVAVIAQNPYVGSVWLRRRTGTGNVTWESANVGVGPTITLTSSWQRFTYDATTAPTKPGSSTYYYGLRIDTAGDAIDIAFGQVEPVTYQTTPGTYNGTTTAAYYGPRFDYDPVTLTANGLLIEEARTNLLINSKADGTTLATQNVAVTAQAYTLSFYGTGTVTLSGASTAGPLVGSGVFPARNSLTFTPTAGTLTLTVSGTVQYAQLEAGAFATSVIPTGSSSVARSADDANMTGTNFTSWYNQTEGTFISQFDSAISAGFGGPLTYYLDGSNRACVQISVAGPYIRSCNLVAGVTDVDLQISGFTSGQTYKFADAYAVNNFGASRNGSATITDTSAALFAATTLGIGRAGVSGGFLNGHVKSIAYYNARLPDAQLQSLSA